MKKFEQLGRSLSKEQQRLIFGSIADLVIDCGRLENCTCNGNQFKCCSNHLDACIKTHCGSGGSWACAG